MFELPEYLTLARQMDGILRGRWVQSGTLGNSPHKFVWYNRTPEEFAQLVRGRRMGQAKVRGRWMAVDLDPGYVLLFGECGGKILYHEPGASLPKKYHLSLTFEDGSFLTATTQMWGAMELFEKGAELERQHVKGMRPTPVDPEFTLDHLSHLIESLAGETRSAKSLLTQDQLIPGLGNAIAQDILFRTGLHPKRPLRDLSLQEIATLHSSIVDLVSEIAEKGGRYDETDLSGHPGGYRRVMDGKSAGGPCPRCGTRIEKIRYLGGACYFCPSCQT